MSRAFDAMHGQAPIQPPMNQNGTGFDLSQLLQYARNFPGNPEQIGQQLLRTNPMFRQQFNSLVEQANELRNDPNLMQIGRLLHLI